MIVFNHEAHERFGLMRVEVIQDKDMGVFRMEVHHGSNMLGKVRFRPRRLDQGGFHLPGDDVTGGDQPGGAMPKVFKFPSFHLPGGHGACRVGRFAGGDSRHFITRVDVDAVRRQAGRVPVEIRYPLDIVFERIGVIDRRIQPVPTPMGL